MLKHFKNKLSLAEGMAYVGNILVQSRYRHWLTQMKHKHKVEETIYFIRVIATIVTKNNHNIGYNICN